MEQLGRAGHAIRHSGRQNVIDNVALGDVVSDELVENFAVIGSPQECADRLAEIAELGFDRIVVINPPPSEGSLDRESASFAQEVLPLL